MAAPRARGAPLAPAFLAPEHGGTMAPPRAPEGPRGRCVICRRREGYGREETHGEPVCAACYHDAANRKLASVEWAKLEAWIRGR